MDDLQFADLVSDDIGRLYRNGKTYSSEMPIHALTFLRGLGNVFCDTLDRDFKAANGLEIKIMSLYERGLLKPQIRRYLRTLQKNGNIAAHPENYDFEEHDFPALVNEALVAARGLIEHLYILMHREAVVPEYKVTQVEDTGLRDMCYSAMIEGDIEATHLAGKYFKEKADRMNKGQSILRARDGYSYEAAPFIDQAMFWFKLGSDKNHPDCQFRLGLYQATLEASDAERSEGEALVYFASTYGHADAQSLMGEFYQRGSIRFTQDNELAMEYYMLAAAQNHPGALAALGFLYAEGVGCEVDEVAAVQCSLRSAEAGFPHAQYNMYCFLSQGKGVETNWDEALKWLNAAAIQDLPCAIYALGMHIHDGDLPDRKCEESLDYFIRSFEHKDFRVESAYGAANVLSGRERSLKDWMLGAHYVQIGYEHIHVHGDPNSLKVLFLKVASEIAQNLRGHISMYGPDVNLRGDDLLACCLFDKKGVPITNKEALMAELKEIFSLVYHGEPGASQQLQNFFIKRSYLKSKPPRIGPTAIPQSVILSTKKGRNEKCPCGSKKKFKMCCGG